MRPVEYITKIRIQQAKRLICNTDKTIKEISFATGFKDCGYFCRVFKRYELMSPVDYRNSDKR